jgi:hypothetical protein
VLAAEEELDVAVVHYLVWAVEDDPDDRKVVQPNPFDSSKYVGLLLRKMGYVFTKMCT